MSEHSHPTGTNALEAAAQLLAAIADALDVPMADERADDATAYRLLRQRAAGAAMIARSTLRPPVSPEAIEAAAAQLIRWTAEHPVSYVSWQERTDAPAKNGGGGPQ